MLVESVFQPNMKFMDDPNISKPALGLIFSSCQAAYGCKKSKNRFTKPTFPPNYRLAELTILSDLFSVLVPALGIVLVTSIDDLIKLVMWPRAT